MKSSATSSTFWATVALSAVVWLSGAWYIADRGFSPASPSGWVFLLGMLAVILHWFGGSALSTVIRDLEAATSALPTVAAAAQTAQVQEVSPSPSSSSVSS